MHCGKTIQTILKAPEWISFWTQKVLRKRTFKLGETEPRHNIFTRGRDIGEYVVGIGE